jgi:beta-phosphoglucomutase family hydrolase
MSQASAFIFDMDGTMVDNMEFHGRAWVEFLAQLGIEMDAEEFLRRTSGMTNARILRSILGPHLSIREVAAYAARKEALYRELYRPYLRPVPGLRSFLAQTRRLDIPLALATSAGWENIAFVLEGLGLTSAFQAVVDADAVERGKPHPEMFLTAAARLGVPPEGCVVFEDSRAGLEAARRAGMAAVALSTTHPPAELGRLPGVVRVVDDFWGLDPRGVLEALEDAGSVET